MNHLTDEQKINEDLMLHAGLGATYSIGSDCYPYYVSEVLEKGVIGLYEPSSHFEKSWEDGHEIVDPYDDNHPTEIYIKRRYGHWWEVRHDGTPIRRWHSIKFGHACSYRDPSF